MARTAAEKSSFIKSLASKHGFLSCGITDANFLASDAPKLENWLSQGKHGTMKWMENHFDKRLNPSKLVPGAKSVICLAYNYFPPRTPSDDSKVKIAKYAYGEDYHFVVKRKMKRFYQELSSELGQFHQRSFVDSAPLLERSLASKAGLGWIGKHSLLLSKQKGSYFFLAEMVCDLELETDTAVTDHCGACTRCIDACPTDAIVEDKVVDATKCISYLTIELKENIPLSFNGKMENWAFGCDICQDVCPWNRFSEPHTEKAFNPNKNWIAMEDEEWHEMSEETFHDLFKKSPLKRTKYTGFKRNLRFIKSDEQ